LTAEPLVSVRRFTESGSTVVRWRLQEDSYTKIGVERSRGAGQRNAVEEAKGQIRKEPDEKGRPRKDKSRKGESPSRLRRTEKGISYLGSPTVYALHPLYQVFLETVGLVIPPDVACPEVRIAVVGVAAASEVAEPVVVFVAVVSVADVSEPQASVDIALAFDALVPVFVVAVEVYSSGRPRFFAFPNIDYYSSSSSSVEVVG